MNKIAFITGATAGIGAASARLFARHGWDLIVTGRRASRLETLRNELFSDGGPEVRTLCFDVRDREATEQAVASLEERWKAVDLLVNNAGLALGTEPFDRSDYRDWDQMIDTNMKGLLYMTREIVPLMIERGTGHIINVASMAGHHVYPGGHVYCATKHAVRALSAGLRIDLVDRGIRVSTVSPGATETEFSIVRYKGDKDKADEKYAGFIPLTGEDIAESIYFIASQPDHVNIEEIYLNPKAQATPFVLHRES